MQLIFEYGIKFVPFYFDLTLTVAKVTLESILISPKSLNYSFRLMSRFLSFHLENSTFYCEGSLSVYLKVSKF